MTEGYVYVIGHKLARVGPVKIGFTSGSVEHRLKALQTGNPVALEVVAAMHAPAILEKKIHAACHEYHLHGEWYERDGIVEGIITEMFWRPEGLLPMCDNAKLFIWTPAEVAICPAASEIWDWCVREKIGLKQWCSALTPLLELYGHVELTSSILCRAFEDGHAAAEAHRRHIEKKQDMFPDCLPWSIVEMASATPAMIA